MNLGFGYAYRFPLCLQGPETNRLAVMEYYWKMLGDRGNKNFVPIEASILNHFKPAISRLEDAADRAEKTMLAAGSSNGTKKKVDASQQPSVVDDKDSDDDDRSSSASSSDLPGWPQQNIYPLFTTNEGDVYQYYTFEEWYINLYGEGEGYYYRGKPAISVIHRRYRKTR